MTNYKFLIIIGCFAFSSCNSNKKVESEEQHENLPEDVVELREDQIKESGIELGSIEMRTISNRLKVNGEISSTPQDMASVTMPLGGRVKSTHLIPGSAVRKGQTLAIIENTDFIDIQQNYLETKSKLDYTATDYARQKELYHNDAASKKNLQLVTSEYRSLQIQKRALEEKLMLIGINPYRLNTNNITRSVALKSPISGYIKSVNVSIGKYVSSSDILFEIINLNKLFIKLTIFEKDIDKIKKGQTIQFYINDETESHQATVYQTAKSLDDDKTYKVYANIQDKCSNILPGMYVNAFIKSKGYKSTAMPENSIVSFDGKDYIFAFLRNKIEDKKNFVEYRMIQVKKGVTDNGYTEIQLPSDFDIQTQEVVVKGAYNLLSALKNTGEMSC